MSNQPLSEQYARQGEIWAELDGAASLLEETKSAVLAELIGKCGDMPHNKAERIVKGSLEWKSFVSNMVQARTKANLAKVKLEYLRMKFFEENSRAATERVQAKM